MFYVAMGVASAARAGVQYGAQSYVKAVDNSGMTPAANNDGKNIAGLSVIPDALLYVRRRSMQSRAVLRLYRLVQRAALHLHRTQGLR